jgi:hypothetical protein
LKRVKGSVGKVRGAKFSGWISNRRQKSKEKEKLEQAKETMPLKLLTFVFTFVAMGLAFSFIPLFPQPLPLLLAALIAFVSFKSPRIGIPVGTTLIGLGLIYHLSEINFIALIGYVPNRIAFTVIWMTLFVVPPIFFRRYKTAIAIDLGIISAMVLFYAPIYYLAIPIILTSAVFFKKSAATTILYYVLIAMPLQIVHYFNYIKTIPQQEWWIVPGSSPPVLVPLNDLFTGLQTSMTQFRLFDTAQFVDVVYSQFTTHPDIVGKTLRSAFTQYLDSFPGIFLFIVIIAGIVLAFVFFARVFVQETSLPYGEQLLAPITAIITTALFFILLDVLQEPLAFSADIDAGTILFATLATALFTLPLSFVTTKPKITATGEMIIAKANELKAELNQFKTNLDNVKESIPVNVSSPEGKMQIINDKLNDILNKFSSAFFAEADLDRLYTDLRENTNHEIKNLSIELNQILTEYQVLVNGEYSDWSGKLKQAGLKISGNIRISPQREMSLEERIASIQAVLIESRNMANDVINTAEPIYNIIRSLYDPDLPEECQVVSFAREKLHNKAPFHAISGLYGGLMNWRKQYGQQVEQSIEQLSRSLNKIIALGERSPDSLTIIFGDKLPIILADVKRAEAIKKANEKTQPNVINILTLREMLDSFIEISKDVLTVLYEEVKDKEQTIEDLTPAQDTLWEKNATLRERMTTAMQELYSPKMELNQLMWHLPKYLDYLDEAVQTLAAYNDRKELLLNYPMAEAAILEQLKIKAKLTPQDLPFQHKYAQEYLRLFYMQRFSQYSFDYQNAWLIKKD